jgi:small subunit ribosomal protein S17
MKERNRRLSEEKMIEKTTMKKKNRKGKEIVVGTRGRVFKGHVTKKFEKRVAIEFERTVYVQKYERFTKKKTRLHAGIPEGMKVEVGDLVQVKECRPLSKILHFMIIKVLSEEEK